MRIKGGKQYCTGSDVDSHVRSPDDVRAMRFVELINDYRSLLMHILEHIRSMPLGDAIQYGYRVLRHNHAAAQHLLASNYIPAVSSTYGEEEQTTQLRQLDNRLLVFRHLLNSCNLSDHQICLDSFTEPATVNLLPPCWKPFSGHEGANVEISKVRISYQAFSAKECQVILPEGSSVRCEICNMNLKHRNLLFEPCRIRVWSSLATATSDLSRKRRKRLVQFYSFLLFSLCFFWEREGKCRQGSHVGPTL